MLVPLVEGRTVRISDLVIILGTMQRWYFVRILHDCPKGSGVRHFPASLACGPNEMGSVLVHDKPR